MELTVGSFKDSTTYVARKACRSGLKGGKRVKQELNKVKKTWEEWK